MGNRLDATPGVTESEAPLHRSVLLHPLIESLQPLRGQTAIDATLGAGGVTAQLLHHVGAVGRVLAIDRDPRAVELARKRFTHAAPLILAHGDFADTLAIAGAHGIYAADCVAMDLGISSTQLDDPGRGFSFRHSAPLDMRMDPGENTETAADIVNGWDPSDISRLLRSYGDERYSGAIARAIGRRREQQPITRTDELREVVERTIPRRAWPKRIHPATRTFQALRIQVNHELQSLERGLQAAIHLLRPGGRLGVISFHSLEDTLVKNTLHVSATNCLCPPQQPCTCAHRASLSIPRRRVIKPDDAELAANPRSRSARLRVAIKLPPDTG